MIFLLLSTFNGERFLAEQINSILDQSFQKWVLLVRDDGSTDSTRAILDSFASLDSRIQILEEKKDFNVGAPASFGILMNAAYRRDGEYFFFVDQDDVWHPEKIELSLARIKSAERGYSGPLLVHSDLKVVDENLKEISHSFFSFMRLRSMPGGTSTFRLLCIQNFVTGCTICFNRAAMEAAIPMPLGVAMHDWWLALCVTAANGHLLFIQDSLIDYRQHSSNAVGAKNGYWRALNIFSASFRKRLKNSNRFIDEIFIQLKAFSIHAKSRNFDISCKRFADSLTEIISFRPFSPRRFLLIASLRPRRQDLLRTIFLYRRLIITERR